MAIAEWREGALCVGEDPELWFSSPGSPEERKARSICFACPVQVECLADADEFGIRAGLNEAQRHVANNPLCPAGRHEWSEAEVRRPDFYTWACDTCEGERRMVAEAKERRLVELDELRGERARLEAELAELVG